MKKSEEESAYVIYAHTPLQYVKSVGPKRAEALASVGLHTVKDLLYYIPYGYIDRTSVQSIASIHHKFKKENDIFNSVSMDIDEAISLKRNHNCCFDSINSRKILRKTGSQNVDCKSFR